MSSEWKLRKLGELATYINGMAVKPSQWNKEGLPIIRIQNLTDPLKPHNYFKGSIDSKYYVIDGDLLISWSASLGAYIWNRGKAVLNQHIFKVIEKKDIIDKEFLYYLVSNVLLEMSSHTHGSTMKHITKPKFEAIEVSVPSLEDQRHIVILLKECFNRIDALENLSAQIQNDTKQLWDSLLCKIENDLGKEKIPLSKVLLTTQNGRSIRSEVGKANGHVLTLGSVRSIDLDCNCAKQVTFDSKIESKYKVKTNDIFISRSNTSELVGLSSIASQSVPVHTIFPDLMIRLEVNRAQIEPRYLAIVLRLPSVRKDIRSRAKGTSQSMVKISASSLKQINIPVPPKVVQFRVIEEFEAIKNIINKIELQQQINKIDALKKSILTNVLQCK